jgi:hypothetical protein
MGMVAFVLEEDKLRGRLSLFVRELVLVICVVRVGEGIRSHSYLDTPSQAAVLRRGYSI